MPVGRWYGPAGWAGDLWRTNPAWPLLAPVRFYAQPFWQRTTIETTSRRHGLHTTRRAGTGKRFGHGPARLGHPFQAHPAGVLIEVPVILADLEKEKLLCHGPILPATCDDLLGLDTPFRLSCRESCLKLFPVGPPRVRLGAELPTGEHSKRQGLGALGLDRGPAGSEEGLTTGGMTLPSSTDALVRRLCPSPAHRSTRRTIEEDM